MKPAAAASARRVQDILGPGYEVLEFEQPTRTAAEAAAAIGCSVAQIAKSLIFRGGASGRPILVVASGDNRVNEKLASEAAGEELVRADADFVREKTGYAIGGVSPVGHREAPLVLIDRDLFRFDRIWAAAGTPNAVFALAPAQLESLTGGAVVPVC